MSEATTEDLTVSPDKETPVAAEASVPTGRAAFAAARAELRSATKETVAEGGDDTSTQPTQQTEVADESQEATPPEDSLLTPAELDSLSPKERAKAEKWQAKLTQKAQRLSAQEKEFQQWQPLVDGLRNDPQATIEAVAKQLGLTVAKAQDPTKAEVTAKVAKALDALPEELRPLFEPAFENLKQEIMASFDGRLRPIAEAQTAMLTEAAATETTATIEAFSSKYKDWKAYEPKMIEIGQKFVPTAGAMSDFEYMETLYKLATVGISQAEQTKKVIERQNRSAESSEARSAGVQSKTVEHVLPPVGQGRSLRAAYEAAKRGETWTK